MRILYLSQYFPPEVGATQGRAYDMARSLVRAGHRVTVLTEVPNHPSGRIPPGYRGVLLERSTMDGIDVLRVWVKTSPVKTTYSRLALYFSYMVNATLAGLFFLRGCHDMLYASSPPLFVGGAALAISILKRMPMVFEVRDLWPESAVALRELTHPGLTALAVRLEEACYRRARRVVVVTPGMMRRLIGRGLPERKLVLIPNGANMDLFRYSAKGRRRIRAALGLQEGFVAVYAGLHGLAQGLETVLETARILAADPSIHFLMIGEGPEKNRLIEMKAAYGLTNVTFAGEKPREEMPDWLSAADAAVIPLRKHELFKGALPTKLFEAWACRRPVILGIDGDARNLLEQAEGGLYVDPEDPSSLAQALLRLKKDPEGREKMGLNGQTFTRTHYSRTAQSAQLVHLLQETATLS